MRRVTLLYAAAAALFQVVTAPAVFADPILGSQLASFAVLGASTVTNTGSTTIDGNVGVDAGSAIVPGSIGFTFAGDSAGISIVNGVAHTAQDQLDPAMGFLAGLATSGTILNGVLDGQTLSQGVYAVSAAPGNGGFNLSTGAVLHLDAQGLTNPFWVFQMSSTLITGSGSVVDFINAPTSGFNPGVYWEVGSSATLGTYSTLQGNILAETSIGLNTGAKIGCGSALADNGAVTLDTNTISTGCNGASAFSTADTGGGPVVIGPDGNPIHVPEPGTLLLFGTGIAALVARKRRAMRLQEL